MPVLPLARTVFTDSAGKPLIAGLVWTYAVGTQQPAVTWQDQACLLANTNPVVLDAAGSATIFGLPGVSYSLLVYDVQGTAVAGMSGVCTAPVVLPVLSASDVGGVNALAGTVPGATALAGLLGQQLVMLACRRTNTGATTLNVNGLGAVAVVNPDGSALQAGQIAGGGLVVLVYDGTRFELVSPVSPFSAPPVTSVVGQTGAVTAAQIIAAGVAAQGGNSAIAFDVQDAVNAHEAVALDQFTSLLDDSGWCAGPDGLIEQWGVGGTSGGSVGISWPKPFTTAVYKNSFIVGATGTSAALVSAVLADPTSVTLSGANVYSAPGTSIGFTYRVKGK